ncbi:Zn-ribbon domain-containing OB-fold protein [Pseudochelatococcus sp. B33]
MNDTPLYTDPPENTDSAPFYDAAAEGRFLGRQCTACGEFHWYPRPFCPFCAGATEWVDMSPHGTIYSFSVSRRASPPFAIAYVELADGPRMLTNIVNCDFDTLRIGQPVRLKFMPTMGGRHVPCFEPADADASGKDNREDAQP